MGGHRSTAPPLGDGGVSGLMPGGDVVPVLLTSTTSLDTSLVTVTRGCRRAVRGVARRGGSAGVDGPAQAPPPRLERRAVAVAARGRRGGAGWGCPRAVELGEGGRCSGVGGLAASRGRGASRPCLPSSRLARAHSCRARRIAVAGAGHRGVERLNIRARRTPTLGSVPG